MVNRQQHGMIEWLKNASEYSDNHWYTLTQDSLARAVRSRSETVVLYGREFDPSVDSWDDAIRHVESYILAERHLTSPAIVNHNA